MKHNGPMWGFFQRGVLYSLAYNVPLMVLIYGFGGVSFWTIQTFGFVFNSDLISDNGKGRLLSRHDAVMALCLEPAGSLIGGLLADIQFKSLGLSAFAAYVNTFCAH